MRGPRVREQRSTCTLLLALMKAPGGIMGVYSQSKDTPLKILGAGGATYADWKFIYQPATATPIKPAAPAKPATPAAPTAR